MNKTVEFIFDFGSPNAYLAYKAIHSLLARTDADLVIVPCLLGGIFKATGNKPPFVAYGEVKSKVDYEFKEIERFCKKHDLRNFKLNPHFPVNTLTLMRGAIVAEQQGQLQAYVEAGLQAMWEDGLKMDDPAVLASVLDKAGFDSAHYSEQVQNQAVKAKLASNTEQAVARGVFGIPSFFVGNEMFFGKDRLDQVEEALMSG